MPQVRYTVDVQDGVWNVSLQGRSFGPYSTMETAMQAAMDAARKAEVMGYEAMVVVAAGGDDVKPPDERAASRSA